MIPNVQFLRALNPICSRFLKKHAPGIPIDPYFQAAVLPKFQDRKIFVKGQCDWGVAKLGSSLVMVVEIVKEPRQHNSESESEISDSLKSRLNIPYSLAGL